MIKLTLSTHQASCILEALASQMLEHKVDYNSSAAQAFRATYEQHKKSTSTPTYSGFVWTCIDKYTI